jgi:hypothetical protein
MRFATVLVVVLLCSAALLGAIPPPPLVRYGHQPSIRSARVKLLDARLALDAARQLPVPHAIDNLLAVAVQQLRAARSALADPATLPSSFRN